MSYQLALQAIAELTAVETAAGQDTVSAEAGAERRLMVDAARAVAVILNIT